jgi:hypothetical protein
MESPPGLSDWQGRQTRDLGIKTHLSGNGVYQELGD